MKTKYIFISLLLVSLLVGCDNNNDSTESINTSSSSNSSTQSSDIISSLSSSSNSSSTTNNAGNALNSLGYYGENVLLGDQLIVGQWQLMQSDTAVAEFSFENSGDATEYGVNLSYTKDFIYGIDENGTTLFRSAGMFDGDSDFVCEQFIDKCCTFTAQGSGTTYQLCKVESGQI